ncbi:MAG: TRAP transporter large permease [bacterium]|nr:TRAP transporter large permease [bacterium]MDY5564443.1 TRAP transporter large permease [Candidatus Limivicinus sp.]
MEAFVLFFVFALLLLLGTPIAVCLGISSILSMLVLGAGRPVSVVLGTVPQLVSAATSKSVLLAIPFFILGGNIMEKSGISGKLINLAESCVGHLKGGVAMVCVIVACFFAAISGSGPATVAALGLILIPAMVKVGYDAPFAAALMATAGAIGVIIPPSITFVVYGSISDTSIGDLFISGVLPGLLMGAALIIITLWLGRKSDLKRLPRCTGAQRWKAFKGAFWGLLMPVIILGGIYGGIFTPTEAAAVSAVYGLVIGVFVYRTIKMKQFIKILIDTASTTATVMFITAAATLFAYVLTRARIDVAISGLLTDVAGGNKIIFLLIVNVVLLLAGCFLDSTSALYIFTPLFVPVAQALGMSMVHFGTIMIVNLAIGLVTPPVGVNLYVACGIADVDLRKISVSVVPLLVASLVVLLLVTYVPSLSLFLLGG